MIGMSEETNELEQVDVDLGLEPEPEPEPEPSETALVVGDAHALRGHCMVAYPDGSVVTASRSLTVVMAGEYRVIYPGDVVETLTVSAPRKPRRGNKS